MSPIKRRELPIVASPPGYWYLPAMNAEANSIFSHAAQSSDYLSETVGSLMERTEAVFLAGTRVQDLIVALKGIISRQFTTYSFIVDRQNHLVGVVTMRELLFSAPDDVVDNIMVKNPFYLQPQTETMEAMKQVVARHFPEYPVCLPDGTFIGTVRGQKLFEAQAFEISAQPGQMVGVEKEERVNTAWRRSFRFRHPWLQLNLLTAFFAGGVVSVFQETIDQLVILAVFLPILAGQSGNTGCQALAVTLRGMTLGDLKAGSERRVVAKEALLGSLNGFFVGLIAAIGMYVLATMQGNEGAIPLALTVLFAMVGSCTVSGVAGAIVPLTLRRLGADPATASSIFLTTMTDIASMGLLLGLATTLLL